MATSAAADCAALESNQSDHLRTKIAATNTKYRSILLPQLKARGEAAARLATEEKARAERAAEEAANLALDETE